MAHRPTPRPAASSPGPSSLSALDWVIGLHVRVTTILDDTITGQVFAYDPLSSTVTLITPSPSSPAQVDLRFLKTSFLKDAAATEVGRKNVGFAAAEPRIGYINTGAVREREKAEARVGKGVTKEAQDIFDALSRTMACRWHEKQIVVLDSVVISEPYGIADVKGNDQNAAKRVKKVLEGERRKLESGKRTGTPVEKKGG